MRKNNLIGIVVLFIILAGIVLYAAIRPVPASAPGTAGMLPALPEGKYTEQTPYYDIAANYATSTPLDSSANATAITLMKNFVSDTIEQFKSGIDLSNAQGNKAKLQIVYLIASSPHTISYIFTIYEETSRIHGNTLFKTFTFDTGSGALLALTNLFTPGSDYLDTLSSLARAKLPDIIGQGADTTFISNGTTPIDKNFENFFFDNQDFVILFAPYQVAPYTAGPQTLRIPVSELSHILKLAYR
ncbi:MAG TPA: RsiV family protein [Candidatus Paceibacterota bacterium]|nr:RsiV family protein [Candidatus Paceibacterota bacterium]